jgi:hypothetical protein
VRLKADDHKRAGSPTSPTKIEIAPTTSETVDAATPATVHGSNRLADRSSSMITR